MRWYCHPVRSRAFSAFRHPSFQQKPLTRPSRPHIMTTNSTKKTVFLALAQNWMQIMLPRLRPYEKDSVQETTYAELEFASVMTEFWLETYQISNHVFNSIEDKELARTCSEYMTWSWCSRLELTKPPQRPAWLPESYFFVRLPMQ